MTSKPSAKAPPPVQAVGQVPASLIKWAAGVIGISPQIVAAQINLESGGDPAAVSPTGAEGVAQFEPGTWASQGCAGSPSDVNSAMACYAQYMFALKGQFGGNVRDALAAYNAGPGNLPAGYGYADTILANAGDPQSATDRAKATLDASNSSASQVTPCLVIMPAVGPVGGGCVFTKAEARAFIGGMCIAGGALLMLPGLILLAAAGFRLSGAGGALGQAAGPLEGVPVYGSAIRYTRTRRAARAAGRAAQRSSGPP